MKVAEVLQWIGVKGQHRGRRFWLFLHLPLCLSLLITKSTMIASHQERDLNNAEFRPGKIIPANHSGHWFYNLDKIVVP